MHDDSTQITCQFASLLPDDKGRLPDHDLLNNAIRGAVLLDLARLEKLQQFPDHIEINSEPIGDLILDSALRQLSGAGITMDEYVRQGSMELRDVREYMEQNGLWKASNSRFFKRRYQVLDPGLLELRNAPSDDLRASCPVLFSLLKCVGKVTRPPTRPSQATIDSAGGASWVLNIVVDDLLAIQRENEQTGWALRLSH